MNYVLANNDNIVDFASVLPEDFIDINNRSIVAYEDDGSVCGAISVSRGDIYYDIDWLYVVPERRLRGIGRGLIWEVKRMVESIGRCPVHALFDATLDNGLFEFFMSISERNLFVDVEYAYDRFIVPVEDFLGSPAIKKEHKLKYKPSPFFKLEPYMRNKLLTKTIDNLTITNEEDLPSTCEKKLCVAVVDKQNPLGLMLVQKELSDDLHLTYLFAEDGMALYTILKFAEMVLGQYFMGRNIYFDAINNKSYKLARNIFPDAVTHKIYEADF